MSPFSSLFESFSLFGLLKTSTSNDRGWERVVLGGIKSGGNGISSLFLTTDINGIESSHGETTPIEGVIVFADDDGD